MTKQDALDLIDQHKNALIDPVEMLHWTWLRVILSNLSEEAWDDALAKAEPILAR